ncbi:MAG: class I SAM-dependent methyltransferase [Planctomycetes bacterium]|nr:class I SAM-dependent methyltransferase [Planctomycetota bacterium]
MHSDRKRWNEKYRTGRLPEGLNISLLMLQDRLTRGRALDVAAGTGENAALLALAGWHVVACDISDEAVRRTRARAEELRTRVQIVQADACFLPFRGPFDLIVCTYFVERAITRELAALLRTGGTLFFQSYTTEHLKYGSALRREFLLEPGELRRMFPLQEVLYREEDDGRRATALLVARKLG